MKTIEELAQLTKEEFLLEWEEMTEEERDLVLKQSLEIIEKTTEVFVNFANTIRNIARDFTLHVTEQFEDIRKELGNGKNNGHP